MHTYVTYETWKNCHDERIRQWEGQIKYEHNIVRSVPARRVENEGTALAAEKKVQTNKWSKPG